jgi:hypothetical protein
MALPKSLRGKSTKAKLGRLNRKIKGIKRRDAQSGGVYPSGVNPRLAQLRKRRGALQTQFKTEQKQKQNRQDMQMLLDPTSMLSGRALGRLANATTRIELLPAIRAKRGQITASNKAQARDVQALTGMGDRLRGELGTISDKLGAYGRENLAAQQGITANTQARLTANADAATDRLNQLQSGILGKQISALAAQKIQPGASAGDEAMAGQANLQQTQNAGAIDTWQGLATNAAAAAERGVVGLNAANQTEAANQQSAVARNIASRIADTQAAGAEERRGLRTELGTIKATRGATKLKNLMALRREQQTFGNERAQTLAALQQNKAKNAIDWYEAQTGRLGQQADAMDDRADNAREDAGGGGGRDKLSLDKEEWKVGKAAAEQYRSGDKIVRWNRFMDELESQPGVSFTAVERKKFLKKYRKWLSKQK